MMSTSALPPADGRWDPTVASLKTPKTKGCQYVVDTFKKYIKMKSKREKKIKLN